MLTLLKKDFLLAKKQIITIVIYSLLCAPVLFSTTEPSQLKSVFLLGICSFIAVYMVSNSLSISESSNAKALSFLCALPYNRSTFVTEKYVLDLILLMVSEAAFYATSVIFDTVPRLELMFYLGAAILVAGYRSILIPLEIVFGYENTKFISLVMLMLFAFGTPMYINQFGIPEINIAWFERLNDVQKNGLLLCVFLLIEFVSITVSYRCFKRKEL